MKRVLKYVLAALCVALIVGTFVFLWKKSRPVKDKFEEIEVSRRSISRTAVVTGKIQPRDEVNIKPQINGIVAELYKEAGQSVAAGEIIAKLKVIPDMSQLSSAQSRVRLAEINLKQAKTNYDREKALYDKDLVSAEEYDQILQSYNQAVEEKAAAQDALEVIRDGVSSTNAGGSSTLVRSTVSGLILDIPVKVGNSVIQANTMNDGTTVATVADMTKLIFDGQIDETEVGTLVEGMPMTITIGALPDYRSEATLEYISPKAVENNGANQFEIKAAVEVGSGFKIRSGYSSNAEIVLEHADSVLAIQESALEFSGDTTFVYRLKDEDYEKVAVKTGLSDGLYIQITEGLEVGDKLRGNKVYKEAGK